VTEKPAAAVADRVLAERVWRDSDEGAFRTLHRRHTPALYQFALRLLGGNEHEAEDVVQDTWIRAVEHLAEFRWEASLKTWLAGIALNLCRGLFRRKDRGWITLRVADEPTADPRSEIELWDLEDAIAGLPPGYRTVLVLHDVEGFTHEEIAGRLEISPNTSKSQLSRARRALRVALAGETGTRVES
jgi:RNA polymerase sigma-70 factor (ECF subfamily)